jgi:trehalose 6-phosphate phosphatase
MSAPLGEGPAARAAFQRLRTARAPLLFLDLDGTLAPIVDDPLRARIPAATRQHLRRLERSGASLVLVSGRSVAGVRHVARIPITAILGDHGARLYRSGRITAWLPASEPRIRRAAVLVRRWVENRAGIVLQEKDRSLAIHLRLARSDAVVSELARRLRASGYRVLHGHRVLDVLLPGVHKGAAVRRWLAVHPEADQVLYAGDDTTDQDAFRALRGRAITIAVGPRAEGAALRTRDTRSFAAWLGRLAAARGG